jgi:hypothetical protein
MIGYWDVSDIPSYRTNIVRTRLTNSWAIEMADMFPQYVASRHVRSALMLRADILGVDTVPTQPMYVKVQTRMATNENKRYVPPNC